MPSIKVKDGKTINPIATKLILTGLSNLEIKLKNAKIVTAKQSFCIVSLAEHYLKNKDQFGDVEKFIEYISKNYSKVNLETQKGIILGTDIHKRFLNKVEKYIKAQILVEWHREHGILKNL